MAQILIIDDSALVRRQLREILEGAGHSVSIARNGREGLEAALKLSPDLITLDVNMPEMSGIDCLKAILAERPIPIIMVSSLMAEGAEISLQAMEIGAVDVVCKPDGSHSRRMVYVAAELVTKIDAGLSAQVRPPGRSSGKTNRTGGAGTATLGLAKPKRRSGFPVFVIGSSTGGPRALQRVLGELPADFPGAIVIAQHMPANFTRVFATRLAKELPLKIREATQRTLLEPGCCYIGRGEADCLISGSGARLHVGPMPAADGASWRPSVNRLVETALASVPIERLVGVMLTGMGDDGAEAMTEMKNRGAPVIAESKDSCVVFGMPARLIERGGASVVLHRDEIARAMLELAGHAQTKLAAG